MEEIQNLTQLLEISSREKSSSFKVGGGAQLMLGERRGQLQSEGAGEQVM